jgi:plasmid stabilization system protein ParE
MRVVKLPRALLDLVETAEYIAKDDVDAADRFFDAFEASLELICRTPKIGSIRQFEDRVEVRMWPIRGFEKTLIFYTESPDEIVILRVIHSSRDYARFIGG